MQNWLRRQNSFTRWAAMGTAASGATGLGTIAVLIVTIIAAFVLGARTPYGVVGYPQLLETVGQATLYVIGISAVSFFLSAACLIVGILTGTNARAEQAEE